MAEEKDVKNLMIADAGSGFEDLAATDFSAPFLVIVQNSSPYVNEQHQLYNPEARPGRILNTQSGRVYKECHIIPVRFTFRNVEWRPRNSGGGFVASYDRDDTPEDLSNDPLTGLIVRSNGNIIQQTAYYLALIREEGWDKIIIPMYSTQLKKSRRWNSMMISYKIDDKTMPIYSNIYSLSVAAESNNKGTWFGWRIDHDQIVDELSIYQVAKTIHTTVVNFLPERLIASMTKDDDNGAM